MNDLISVIIPVYNVAAYLPQCLDSVLRQDHNALEVILIDDGSTDDSGRICDAYACKDPRIRVIHQKNAGAAAAKNAGLRVAAGTYLSFVDSDDYLEPNVYGYMLDVLKSSGAAAAQFAFREVYTNRTEEQIMHPGRSSLDNREYLVRFTKDWSCPLLWNKLYRRELYEGVFFEEGHKIDDEYFTYQGFLRAGNVIFDDKIIYNYRKRASSVMASPEAAEQRILDCVDSMYKRREKVLTVFPELRKAYDENYLDVVWYLSENPGNSQRTLRTLRQYLKDYFCTPGNSIPPRFLWGRLLRFWITSPEKRLEQCKIHAEAINRQDYFV